MAEKKPELRQEQIQETPKLVPHLEEIEEAKELMYTLKAGRNSRAVIETALRKNHPSLSEEELAGLMESVPADSDA